MDMKSNLRDSAYFFIILIAMIVLYESFGVKEMGGILTTLQAIFISDLLVKLHLRLTKGKKSEFQIPFNVPLILVSALGGLIWSFYYQLDLVHGLFTVLTGASLGYLISGLAIAIYRFWQEKNCQNNKPSLGND